MEFLQKIVGGKYSNYHTVTLHSVEKRKILSHQNFFSVKIVL